MNRIVASVAGRFSSAAGRRSASYVSSSAGGASPRTTEASFQARFSASATPELRPRAPNGDMTWAASPARKTRPARNASASALAEAVAGDPHELVRRPLADDGADPPVQAAVDALGVGIGLGRDLPVDPPDAVGLGVDQHLPPRVPGRVEVEVPLVREGQIGPDVGDEEPVVEGVPGEADAGGVADGRVGAIGADQVAGPMRHLAAIGVERGVDALGILRQAGEPVAAPDPDAQRDRAGLEELLDLRLADVHERREVLVVARGGRR